MDTITSTDIVPAVERNPAMVLVNRERFDEFYEAIRREAESHEPDLTTDRGRKAIGSLAHKIARTKTAIDDAGKKLNEQARQQINVVDAARRAIREKLDALKDQVRAPLTAWEARETAREEEIAAKIAFLDLISIVNQGATSAQVGDAVETVAAMIFDPDTYQARLPEIEQRRAEVVARLSDVQSRIAREETDRAELERLRAEATAREEAERLAREAEAARMRAEQAEREHIAAEKRAKAEREEAIARAAHDAEERARADAERAAKAEQDRKAEEHRAELAKVQREADAAAKRERDRIAEAERVAAEDRRRAADREHRGAIMKAAKEALMEHAALDEDQAKRVVLAITGGHVPHVEVKF